MNDEFGWIEDGDINELISRFEKMLGSQMHLFFDVNDLPFVPSGLSY